jgi:hypothetical protein
MLRCLLEIGLVALVAGSAVGTAFSIIPGIITGITGSIATTATTGAAGAAGLIDAPAAAAMMQAYEEGAGQIISSSACVWVSA